MLAFLQSWEASFFRDLSLFPERASTIAASVDHLYFFLIFSTVSLATILAILVVVFAVRYHRSSPGEIPIQISGNNTMEWGWTIAAFLLFLVMFFWGVRVYYAQSVPPPNALDIFVVGKQWMWKVQHPDGQREINELHVPVGQPVRITLTSQDVIHSFFVPAFRVKQDAIPSRYTTLWFTATKPGKYHLFCAEYCGTKHSGMVGWVYAMLPGDYSRWLTAGGAEGSLASDGEKLYHQYGCSTCHDLGGHGPGPSFVGLYGNPVRLSDGRTVTADEVYIRESILEPQAKIVLGFGTIMPTFQGQLDEDKILAIIEWMKSIGGLPASPAQNPTGGPIPSSTYGPQPQGPQPARTLIQGPEPAGSNRMSGSRPSQR